MDLSKNTIEETKRRLSKVGFFLSTSSLSKAGIAVTDFDRSLKATTCFGDKIQTMKLFVYVLALAALLCAAVPAQAEISASRSITTINGVDLDIEIDGCTKKDKWGCKSLNTDWGKNISGTVHAKLKEDLIEGSYFISTMHLKTGLFPIPFKIQCKLCNARCGFKVPILEKDFDVEMPPCPITAGEVTQHFNEMIPRNDPVPLKLGVDGIANVYNGNGHEIAAVHFTGSVSNQPALEVQLELM